MSQKKEYEPSKDVLENANIQDYEEYRQEGMINPEGFWEEAAEELKWYKKWDTVLDDSNIPFFKWFVGAKTNIVENALERHLEDKKEKTAIIYEDEKGRSRELTYEELNEEVCKFANALKELGIKKGDKVVTYLPNIPEQAISMLACAKIGAIHSVIFAGYSHKAVRERIKECEAKIVITADGNYRKGKKINLKETVEKALEGISGVEKTLVVNNLEEEPSTEENQILWKDLMEGKSKKCKTVEMNSNDPLFILYTSGTTGKPKGVVHDHGGYQVGVATTLKWTFDIKDDDIFWSTSDAGWITGHSYMVYGPLLLGITTVMYDGAPTHPSPERWWKLIEERGVTIFYTAPTAVRLFMKLGKEHIENYDLSSLRLLGSVGEPINPAAWKWFYEVIGNNKCPIMDTWWQTETGMFMITPHPTTKLKPGSACKPFPGIEAFIIEEEKPHRIVRPGEKGLLVIGSPWPAMLRTLYNNPERYVEEYWKEFPGYYATGDYATQDWDGYFWIEGRADDVIKISSHRIGSAEVENILVSHNEVAEAAVIGVPDEIRGQVIEAYVTLKKGSEGTKELKEELKTHIKEHFGPIAVTKEIHFKDELPKTRSGKIMRRVLRAWSKGEDPGDLSTMKN